ncbi:MAG: glycosyltransferase family 4 protein [Chloroflexi bacterium]|nr:glycosyltransferase family 4 protein [Chloroflexota bacterium]
MVPKPLGRRIRVARVITRLNVGGPSLQALLLSARLDAARFETLLICGVPSEREGDIRDLRADEGVRPLVVPALGRRISVLDDLRAFVAVVRALRAYRPDIVHTHLAKAGFHGRVAARLVGVPVVIHTFHGNVLSGYFGTLRSAIFRGIERVLAALSTRIIAISASQRAEIERIGIARAPKLFEIPLGLDLRPFLDPVPGALRSELGIASDRPIVGIAARLVPIKGVDVFLDACAIVARARDDTLFVIAGDGELREALEARTRELGLASRTRFLGWRADLAAVYADCDVVVLTSHNEGTPVSLIEAMTSGRAVIATDVGGVRDVVGANGILVPDGDRDAIARAILALLGDPGRREALGRQARESVYPCFDVSGLVQRIDALYTELVG